MFSRNNVVGRATLTEERHSFTEKKLAKRTFDDILIIVE